MGDFNFSYEAILVYSIIALLGWLILFMIKNKDAAILMFFKSLIGYLTFLVISLLMFVGIDLVIIIFMQKLYLLLFIPIFCFYFSLVQIKHLLKRYFGIEIISSNLSCDIKFWKLFFVLLFTTSVTTLFTFIMFFQVLPDTDNHVNGTFPLILINIFFLFCTIGLLIVLLNVIKTKLKIKKPQQINQTFMHGKTLGIVLATPGLFFALLGLSIFYHNYEFRNKGIKTEGNIFEIKCDGPNDNNNCVVKVQYLVNGEPKINYSNSWNSSMKEGDQVTVYYNKDNVDRFIISSFLANYSPLIFTFLGLPWVFIGIKLTRKNKIKETVY